MVARRRSPTMQDVADTVGVSKQTVSAVINGKQGITDETRARVLEAVDRLGYRPDSIARSLRTGRTRTIGLVLSDISSPFHSEMAAATEGYLRALGYRLILYNTEDDVEREAAYFDDAIERGVDGVIFTSATDESRHLSALKAASIPYVAVDRIPDPYTGPSVMLDNESAGRIAAEHLMDLGHTRLAHISGPCWVRMTRERLLGLRHSVSRRGTVSHLVVEHAENWRCRSGYEAMQQILTRSPLPTAVFSSGDLLAIGAMLAIREAGLRVPDDISVVGLDDLTIAAFQNPPLTTVRQSITELATLGARLLFDILGNGEITEVETVMEPILVVRQSTAPPPD